MAQKKKPFLKDKHKKARLEWCLERQYWTLEEWKQVIWTNESTLELGGGGGGRRRYWRRQRRVVIKEPYSSQYIHQNQLLKVVDLLS